MISICLALSKTFMAAYPVTMREGRASAVLHNPLKKIRQSGPLSDLKRATVTKAGQYPYALS
jgi:hypothetical protein